MGGGGSACRRLTTAFIVLEYTSTQVESTEGQYSPYRGVCLPSLKKSIMGLQRATIL